MSRIDQYQASVEALVAEYGSARGVAAAAAEAHAPGCYESWKRWIGQYANAPSPANQIRIIQWAKSVKKS